MDPITDSVLPTAVYINQPSNLLSLAGCRDQYISASFVISAKQTDLSNFLAIPGNLEDSAGHSIPASAVDIRAVKCWYQSGSTTDEYRVSGARSLTPELLLHNDNLIRVDTSAKHNYLKLAGGGELCISTDTQATPNLIQPTDTTTLQPLGIPANTNKQFWVTLHVPANTVQGTYSGTIALSVDGASTAYLPLQLEVYNFTLEQPNQMYGVYYFGQTNSSYPSGTIGPRYKSVTQYTAEVQGMLQHGIRYPSLDMFLYSDWATNPNGLRDMKLRVSLGFPTDYLFWITPGAWGTVPTTQSQLDACKAKTATYLSAAKVGGFQNFVNFGVDEASLSVLASEVPAFTSVRAAGAKNVIADYNSYNVASQVPNIVGLMDFVIWPNVAWNHPELARRQLA